MTVLESSDYQAARNRIKGNLVISWMAACVAAPPLTELAHEDGTPRFAFTQQANRAFDGAEARNAGNPSYEPYPADAPRHLGLIAEAVLASAGECALPGRLLPGPAGGHRPRVSQPGQSVAALRRRPRALR